jgi:hypothetical protein
MQEVVAVAVDILAVEAAQQMDLQDVPEEEEDLLFSYPLNHLM